MRVDRVAIRMVCWYLMMVYLLDESFAVFDQSKQLGLSLFKTARAVAQIEFAPFWVVKERLRNPKIAQFSDGRGCRCVMLPV